MTDLSTQLSDAEAKLDRLEAQADRIDDLQAQILEHLGVLARELQRYAERDGDANKAAHFARVADTFS